MGILGKPRELYSIQSHSALQTSRSFSKYIRLWLIINPQIILDVAQSDSLNHLVRSLSASVTHDVVFFPFRIVLAFFPFFSISRSNLSNCLKIVLGCDFWIVWYFPPLVTRSSSFFFFSLKEFILHELIIIFYLHCLMKYI